MISCQKHHLLGKQVTLAVLFSSLSVSIIIRMSFVSLGVFMFQWLDFFFYQQIEYFIPFMYQKVKLNKIQKTLPSMSLLKRFNHIPFWMQTREN